MTSSAQQAQDWIDAFEKALATKDAQAFDDLFLQQCYWRDMVALTWDTQQHWGRDAVRRAIFRHAGAAQLTNLRLAPDRTPPTIVATMGVDLLEVFFQFDTAAGDGVAFAKLALDSEAPQGLRAHLLATQLVALNCAREPSARHPAQGFDPAYPGQTWGEYVAAKSDFKDRDPDVLIVGAGHSGLSIAARMERMGISYLMIDKGKAPGQSWRERYESLSLHTNTPANDLPYIEIPKHWGTFTAKDQWADWLECYAKLMTLNCWSSTLFLGGSFDNDARHWTVRIKLSNGNLRTMRPKHVVLAIGGIGGQPRIAELPGLKDFRGEVLHSSAYKTGTNYQSKNVMVVGSSTSGHDICLDLYHKGATVAMAQRGPACVVNISEAERLNTDFTDGTMSKEEADQRRSGNAILPLLIKRTQAHTVNTERELAELHAGLRKVGMKLTIGEDGTGWLMKLFRDLAGYYLNVGCSEIIAAGGIKIVPSESIDRFVPEGARLQDGSIIPLDAVVLATGFLNLLVDVEAMFGIDVAARVGRIGGVAEDGEPRNLCRPTGQPHLWFIFGGIIDARKSSPLLAFQIAAQLAGVVPTFVRQADGDIGALPANAPISVAAGVSG